VLYEYAGFTTEHTVQMHDRVIFCSTSCFVCSTNHPSVKPEGLIDDPASLGPFKQCAAEPLIFYHKTTLPIRLLECINHDLSTLCTSLLTLYCQTLCANPKRFISRLLITATNMAACTSLPWRYAVSAAVILSQFIRDKIF